MSLKETLKTFLETNGYLSLDQLEKICKSEGRKFDNGTRRMRELVAANPAIKPILNAHGAIIAYSCTAYPEFKPMRTTATVNPTFCFYCFKKMAHPKGVECHLQPKIETNQLF